MGRRPGEPSSFQWRVKAATQPVLDHSPAEISGMATLGTPMGCRARFITCSMLGPLAVYEGLLCWGTPVNSAAAMR